MHVGSQTGNGASRQRHVCRSSLPSRVRPSPVLTYHIRKQKPRVVRPTQHVDPHDRRAGHARSRTKRKATHRRHRIQRARSAATRASAAWPARCAGARRRRIDDRAPGRRRPHAAAARASRPQPWRRARQRGRSPGGTAWPLARRRRGRRRRRRRCPTSRRHTARRPCRTSRGSAGQRHARGGSVSAAASSCAPCAAKGRPMARVRSLLARAHALLDRRGARGPGARWRRVLSRAPRHRRPHAAAARATRHQHGAASGAGDHSSGRRRAAFGPPPVAPPVAAARRDLVDVAPVRPGSLAIRGGHANNPPRKPTMSRPPWEGCEPTSLEPLAT